MMAVGETKATTIPLRGGIAMMPVAHSVLSYALQVSAAIAQTRPDCIALELPRAVRGGIDELVGTLPEIHILCYKSSSGIAQMIPNDPCDALIEALRQAREKKIPVELIDTADAGAGVPYFHLPDDAAIETLGLRRYAVQCLRALDALPISERERTIAARLRLLADRHERILYVGGMLHAGNLRRLLRDPQRRGDPANWNEHQLSHQIEPLKENQLGHVMREIAHVAWLYENSRGTTQRFTHDKAMRAVLAEASRQYHQEYDERINLTEWRALFQFGRNLSLMRGMLKPRLLELVTAAKGCVDDDFGAICLEVATSYPPNRMRDELLTGDEEEDNPGRHRSLNLYCDFGGGMERLESPYPSPDLEEVEYSFRRRRPSRDQMALWREQFADDVWNGAGICSWPPEDEFIERFFRTIRTRAQQQVSENHSTVEEFSSSILDGLDVRETMRRWNEKKLFVRRERIPPGKVGAVILIWRDLPLTFNPLWRTCLYAENQNESDIAFYADPLGKEMVGPGISRTEYHGILSIFPAAHIPDMWSERTFHTLGTCARLLAASAVHLSAERFIAYVAAQPPDAELRQYARTYKKSFIYLPLATFSKAMLKRARQCHVLAGKNVRTYAADYIPEI